MSKSAKQVGRKPKPGPFGIDDPLFSISESAQYVGMKEPTIRSWIWRRLLPSYRVGGYSVRIRKSDLDAILNRGFIPADPKASMNSSAA